MVTVPTFDRNWSSDADRKPDPATMGSYNFEDTRTMVEQPPKNMMINDALRECCGIESSAYALAVIRPDGQVATFVSDEVKTNPKFLFTPAFHNEFLKSTGRQTTQLMVPHEFGSLSQPSLSYRKRTPPRSHTAYDDDSSDSSFSLSPGSRKRLRTAISRSRDRAVPTLPTKVIAIGDDLAREDVYRQCLKDMQQNGCKVLGKAWVKLLEPKKQSSYPYTKGSLKTPPWWPAIAGPNKIRHKEPDHLHKRERIILLLHILTIIVNQDGPARQRGIDVAKLEEVTREAMATWFADREKPKNAEKRPFLTQLFRLLYKEERYRRGELDASTTVCVNDASGNTDHDDDDDDEDSDPSSQQQQHQAQPMSPFLPTPPSSLSPSHPITAGATAADMQEYYNGTRVPLRSSYLPASPEATADEYADSSYSMHHHNNISHSQQAPTYPNYPARNWPAQPQEVNVYGTSPWPTPPAAASGSMQQYPFGMPTSSPPQQGSFTMPTTTTTTSPPQQQGQTAVFLPPPMGQGYEDATARGSFDAGSMRPFGPGEPGWDMCS